MKYVLAVLICLIFSVAGFAFGRLTEGEKQRLTHNVSSKVTPPMDHSVRIRVKGDFVDQYGVDWANFNHGRLDLPKFSGTDVFPGLRHYLRRFPLNGVLYGTLER